MTQTAWWDRLRGSTPGKMLDLLRGRTMTVEELADALSMTPSGIRAHMATLQRDGLVQVRSQRPGVRKPSHEYGLTRKAEQALSRAYLPVLTSLVDVLAERMPAAERTRVLQEVGRRLAREAPAGGRHPRARVAAAVRALEDLGGSVTARPGPDGRVRLAASGCPLSELVRNHAEVCEAVRTMLAEITGVPVTELCDRGEHPRCSFDLRETDGPAPE
jgi:predicted ArsR family transcriptional regulator